MKPFNLAFLSLVIIFVSPLSSLAQMKMLSRNSMSGQNRVANGREHTTNKKGTIMEMDGQMDSQVVTFTISNEGIEGPVTGLMIQNLEQVRPGDDTTSKEKLNLGITQEGELAGMTNSQIITEDGFVMTATMTINEQNINMHQKTEEESFIEQIEDFSTTSNSAAFSSPAGFSSNFSF
jgi:hypothetical protein